MSFRERLLEDQRRKRGQERNPQVMAAILRQENVLNLVYGAALGAYVGLIAARSLEWWRGVALVAFLYLLTEWIFRMRDEAALAYDPEFAGDSLQRTMVTCIFAPFFAGVGWLAGGSFGFILLVFISWTFNSRWLARRAYIEDRAGLDPPAPSGNSAGRRAGSQPPVKPPEP